MSNRGASEVERDDESREESHPCFTCSLIKATECLDPKGCKTLLNILTDDKEDNSL